MSINKDNNIKRKGTLINLPIEEAMYRLYTFYI